MRIQHSYINGKWKQGDQSISNINPSDISDKLDEFSQANAAQVNEAISSAKEAHKNWSKTPLEQRQNILKNIGRELMNRSEELGKILSLEEGKSFAEGKGEVFRSGQFFDYFAGEVLRQMGETAQSVRPDIDVEITREALGVVGIISPWNFPMATAAWKIAPALAFGNCVVWKPANLTPASAVALTEIIDRQNLSAGVFNLVLGKGSVAGDALINNEDIDGVTFTGSVSTGRRIAQATSKNFIKCQLEMGSKNALVIADDADMETAVSSAITGAFSGTGQKCTASSRIIVVKKIYDEFVEKMIEAVKTLKVGHALQEGIFMGPVASHEQLESNMNWVKKIKDHGGVLACGGSLLSLEHEGYYMAPTLFIDTKNEWEANQEEIFAPLACVIKANDFEHAVSLANDTRFGLTSGIVTQSLKKATLFKKQAQSGCVMVNLPTAGTDYHVPFGGRKESSYGPREQGQYAKEFYTIVKTTYQKPS